MRLRSITAVVTFLAALSAVATAEENTTVKSLLAQGFAVVGTIVSPIGPGLFLQKKDQLFVCFVAETPRSPTLTTRYCKPVQ